VCSAQAKIGELIECYREFLTTEASHVCNVLFQLEPCRHEISDLGYFTIDCDIQLLGAVDLIIIGTYGLWNLPHMLCRFIIFPLYCQATLLLPKPHGVSHPLADSNTSICSPDATL
jgi:hypothetical protein